MPRSLPMMCSMFSVLTSPACVTNCAEHSNPTNMNSRNGDIFCAMDLVRANSRSPSYLGGAVDARVGWRFSSELVELHDDGERDISSFGYNEPFDPFMVDSSLWMCIMRTQGIPPLHVRLFKFVSYCLRQHCLKFACCAMARFLHVEEMGLHQFLKELYFRNIFTWAGRGDMDHFAAASSSAPHANVGPSFISFVPHQIWSDLRN